MPGLGVNRSTFYLHYDGMADLLSETVEQTLQSLLDKFEERPEDFIRRIGTDERENLILLTPPVSQRVPGVHPGEPGGAAGRLFQPGGPPDPEYGPGSGPAHPVSHHAAVRRAGGGHALAAYTTCRVAMAVVNLRRAGRRGEPLIRELRTVGMVDALVSLLTLQNTLIAIHADGRSMAGLTAWTSGGILLVILAVTASSFYQAARPGKH